MSTPHDSHIDVLLTAYADGSLHEDGCAFIERQLEEHPELRDRLGEIRALQELLRDKLPAVPSHLDEGRRAVVMAAAAKPARAPGRSWQSSIVTLAAACLVLAAIAAIATPNLMESRVTASAAAERARERYLGYSASSSSVGPTAAVSSMPPAPRSLLPGASYKYAAGDSGGSTTNITTLDLPVEIVSSKDENDSQVPKGREEAVADAEMGSQGVFMGIGAGGGAKGEFTRSPADKAGGPVVALQERAKPGDGAAGFYGSRQGGSRRRAADSKPSEPGSAPSSPPTQPAVAGKAKKTDTGNGWATPPPPPPAAAPAPLVAEPAKPGRAPGKEIVEGRQRLDGLQTLAARDRDDRAGRKDALREEEKTKVLFLAKAEELDKQKSEPLSWAPLPQRDLIAALTSRGQAERSTGRLGDVLQQQWFATAQLQQQADTAPIRLLAAPDRPAAATGSAANSVGQNLLLAANRNGLQLLPVPGGVEVQVAQRPLDPTAAFGLTREDFRAAFGSTPMQAISDDAQQTFAIDASTSSFAAARAALEAGRLPDPAAIEPQHAYNAVPADYPKPNGEEAFQLYAEAGPSPFANGPAAARTALVALGVVSRRADAAERMPLDLVIALDVSGSMGRPGGLDRASAGLGALLPQLDARDRVAVVAFGDVARITLPAVAGDQQQRIANALASLRPEGATNAADGLALAYQVAGELAAPGRSCRVVLITDGAALAGEAATTAEAAVERWRGRGVSLLIVGCAGESYDSAALERLARHGDGEHLVAASDAAARELFTGRLMPERLAVLARDAKVQMTWNPARVAHARLIGFETRRLAHEQFRDNRVDAGELTQDAQATALFEVILTEHGSGPLGTAGVRYHDTRLNRVVELSRQLPGGLVAATDSPRLHLLACAAELGEIMQAGWWRNVRSASGSQPHDRLVAELARLDHPFARLLERMARRHQQLERQDATP